MDFFSLNRDSLVGERGLVDLGSALKAAKTNALIPNPVISDSCKQAKTHLETGVPTTGVGGAVPPLRDVLVAIVKLKRKIPRDQIKAQRNVRSQSRRADLKAIKF
jgi:hypothetical protein